MSHETLGNKEVRVRGLGPVTPESCVLILEELKGSRLLPIFTSLADGEAIARKVSGAVTPRPLTHDLLVSTVGALGWEFVRAVVNDVKEGSFYACIDIARDGVERRLEARPTDAINVALRAGVPIFVAERVFELGDSVLKPIAEDEKKQFAADLEKLDLGQIFSELEGKSAPHEASSDELKQLRAAREAAEAGEAPKGEAPNDETPTDDEPLDDGRSEAA